MNLKQWIDTLNIDAIDNTTALLATHQQLNTTLAIINRTIETKPQHRDYAIARKQIVAKLLKQCEAKIADLQQRLI